MLKQFLMVGLTICSILTFAQQNKKKIRVTKYNKILISKNVKEIENFLSRAHPEDPRVFILKPKLISLKNAAWQKSGSSESYMKARPIVSEIPEGVLKNPYSHDSEEFIRLMAESSTAHQERTIKLLNTLFDQDINKKEAILLIQNNSDCNMILNIEGEKFYNLAIPARGENTLVLDKGKYHLSSNVCGSKFSSSKDIKKNIMVILNSGEKKPSSQAYYKANKSSDKFQQL